MQTLSDNQAQAVSKLQMLKVGALFMDPGTGKTYPAVKLIQGIENLDLVIWFGPFSSINPKVDSTGIQSEILKRGGMPCPVEYVGIESISSSDRLYLKLRDMIQKSANVMMVVDESLKIKNATSIRSKRITELGHMCQYRLILNGTQISRDLLDLWAQMEFLSPKILSMSQEQFKKTYCEFAKVTKTIGSKRYTKEYIIKYHNMEHLYSKIKPYIFEASLDLDIHEQHFDIPFTLSEESKQLYEETKKSILNEETMVRFNNQVFLKLTQKLQHQYCAEPSKIEAVRSIISLLNPRETIIFTGYIKSREVCESLFPQSLVLSLKKESMSLNLQAYTNIIFWDKTWDWALVDQAQHRIYRKGQTRPVRYYHVNADTKLDGLMIQNNKKKESVLATFKELSIKNFEDL